MRRPPVRSVQWTKLLGFAMVTLAVVLVMDPDYPIPRKADAKASAAPREGLAQEARPRALSPRGNCAADALDFTWEWDGPPLRWRIAVLDAHLEEVWSSTAEGCRAPASAELLSRLRPEQPFYWFVEASSHGRRVRCSCVTNGGLIRRDDAARTGPGK